MAIVHRATLTPGKTELIGSWLDGRRAGASAPVAVRGSYRFDDPEGQVGVEGMLLARGEGLVHLALTYRSAPLPGADEALVGRMEHSVLGSRWVYAAAADPVGVGCFERALRGEQDQATLEVHDGGRVVARRESDVRLRLERGGGSGTALRLAEDLGEGPIPAGPCLVATLGDLEAPIAWLA